MADTFGFSLNDAKRIGKTVRVVERSDSRDRVAARDDTLSRAVRIVIGKSGTASWSKGASKTVTIYGGTPGADGVGSISAVTVSAWNVFATLSTVSQSRVVALSNNGWGWYLIAAEC